MSTIAAGTTSTTGMVQSSDTTGNLVFQTNGTTTALTISNAQLATFANPPVTTGAAGGTKFTASGTFTPTVTGKYMIMLQAGGGGGGGGGGSYVASYQTVSGTTYNVTVGAGQPSNGGGTAPSSGFGSTSNGGATGNGGAGGNIYVVGEGLTPGSYVWYKFSPIDIFTP